MFNISIFKTESFKKGIAFSTVLGVFSKGLTFCTTLLIAFYFGTSLEIDIYFFVISFVTSISLFITGCTTSVIIPEVMYLCENNHREMAMRITNFILLLFLVITIIPVFLFSVMPVPVFTRISRFTSLTILEHRFYFTASSLLLIFITVNTYLKEVLSIYRFFTFPMIISMVNSILTLAAIALLQSYIGTKSLIIGVLLGNFINTAMLGWTLRKYANWHFTKLTFKLPGSLFRRILYSQAGYAATAASMWVPSYLLSGVGAGLIAALNFGRQVSDIPGNFLTAQFSAVSGIKFNELMARKQLSELDVVFRKSLTFLLSILTPVCGIIFIFNSELIEILFGRGAFSNESITAASDFSKLFIISAPLIALDYLSTRVLIAAKKIKQSFWYQIGFNLLVISIMVLLFPVFGGKAIPITICISYCLNVIVQPMMFHFWVPHLQYIKALAESIKVLMVNGIIILVIIIFNHWLKKHGCISIIRLTAGSMLYLSVVYFINSFFNINNDLQNIIRSINSKIKMILNFE